MYTIVDLCLLCLANDKNLRNILSQDSDGTLVQEKLRFILFEIVNIEPDTSKHICLHCLEKLNYIYKFKQLCLQNIVKFNSYIHTLNSNTKEPCSNLQVTLIDIKHLNVKLAESENTSNRELIKTENLDNVKSEPSENETGIEYALHGKHMQMTEIGGEIVRMENNRAVKIEHEDISDTAVQEKNVFNEEMPMIVDNGLYEIVGEIVKGKLEDNYDEIDTKSQLDDDLIDKLQNETSNNADELEYEFIDEIKKEEPEEIDDDIDIKRPGRWQESCAGCGAKVAVMLYRDKSGWRCERCAPARRACKDKARGCAYRDIPRKFRKHERYFCEQRTQCRICDSPVSRGTLSAHYASAHEDVTCSAGSTWRATRTGWRNEQCHLVTCPAGTAVCSYRLDDSRFEISVHIPVESDRLSEFRCEVLVTHPTTRLTRTYTPDIRYKGDSDWSIQINQQDFPTWNNEFDVSVNISKG